MYIALNRELKDIRFTHYTKVHKNYSEIFNDDIMCFDTEASSAYLPPNSDTLIPFDANYLRNDNQAASAYWSSCDKYALTYIWMFSINDNVFIGRELADFVQFMIDLEEFEPCMKFVYVHNLSYDFTALQNILDFDEVFAREKRKPLFAICGSFTFRCSLYLTQMSLDTWCRERSLPIKKLVGKLDYNVLRTPNTPLTSDELAYCINDVQAMYYGLLEYKRKYGSVENIPLTQTGEVRRVVQDILTKDYRYMSKCRALLPRSLDDYKYLVDAFQGGYTHANRINAERIIANVDSYDIASSYPTVCCLEKYPMTYFTRTIPINKYFGTDKYSFIITFEVDNILSKRFNTWLSFSHCLAIHNYACDNGRVIRASYVKLHMTNIDFEIFCKCYTSNDAEITKDNVNILDFRVAINDYLPNDFVLYILELYNQKTKLKGIAEHKASYDQSKQYINSASYGMMVCKSNFADDIIFNNDIWDKVLLNDAKFLEKLAKLKKRKRKNFLIYQVGLFIPAYARRNVFNGILANDSTTVYCDTDSIKKIHDNTDYFIKYNKEIERRENERADMLGVSRDIFAPKDKNGVSHRLGIFDYEGTYDRFITLGCKRYCYEEAGNLHLTVAGVNKQEAVKQLRTIEDFKNGIVFDVEHCKKLIAHYLENMQPIIWNRGRVDEYASNQRFGICLQPTTYNLGRCLSDELIDILNFTQNEETEVLKHGTKIL